MLILLCLVPVESGKCMPKTFRRFSHRISNMYLMCMLPQRKKWPKQPVRKSFPVVDEALADPDVHAVLIATSTDTHVETDCKSRESGQSDFM